jgi:hypothetical protein
VAALNIKRAGTGICPYGNKSCDDRLLKKCRQGDIAIDALSPLQFIAKEDLK